MDYGRTIRLSEDLMEPLEKVRRERYDKNIAQTTRALLREVLKSRGLLIEEDGE